MLAGTLAADVDPQDGDTSFVLTVKHANRHGRAYKQAGTATILVDAKTRVRRQGAKTLGALAPNDRVHVTAKACKADLKTGGMPDLTARQVGAHPARHPSRAPSSRQRRRPRGVRKAPLALFRPDDSIVRGPAERPTVAAACASSLSIRYSWRFRADVRLFAFRSSPHSR